MKTYSTTEITLADWQPHPENPREIGEAEARALGASLGAFGLVQPLVVNARTHRIVGGHQRAAILRESGATTAPAVVVDLDEEGERALLVTLNASTSQGRWTDKLDAVLELIPDALAASLRLDVLAIDSTLLGRPADGDLADGGDDPDICPRCGQRMPS